MSVRATILAIAFLAHAAAPVAAQGGAAPPVATELPASRIALGREALGALMLETGVFADLTPAAFSQLKPYFLALITNTRFFATLSADKQRAMVAYFDHDIIAAANEEVMIAAPGVLDRFAPRIAAMFSDAELTDIITFARTPDGAAAIHTSVMAGATGFPPALTAEQLAALEAFSQTNGGRAWTAQQTEFGALMYELGRAATSAPNVRARFMRDLCAISGSDCPAGWRTET